ncbi:two-component system alkaline phosphatase synthesis response regulator PhoP [Breznakia blatticola]|uniref:Two-component system alkaline phosphatase synthesis response regulator PhoP n=1 Tax=Breznakia blatticola TaxID=1754012 RepID=A0A4R7ZS68_9FIRM|nr:response regulator transcription factor [Breznakia blatticola]TDW20612.1 two-component system alkaline phosphatase synthesis response regulator PhoP [Breznakia blatticola]
MKKILLIEDEANIRKLITYDLKVAGFAVEEACDGKVALEKAYSQAYDVFLIDWMIPKIEGIDLVRKFREKGLDGVMIMLTAKDEESNILDAFEAGVDDYITKPFSPRVLLARVQSHLKRNNTKQEQTFSGLRVDENKRKVYLQDSLLQLTKKEYDLLTYFIRNANIVVSRDQILNDIWGFDYDGDTRIVDVHTFKLRSKLKDAPVEIRSSRGVGYILEAKE